MLIVDMSGAYGQQDFWKEQHPQWISCRDMQETLFFCSESAAERLRGCLAQAELCDLHYIDSGDYHYISLFFLERIRRPFTLLLFDHHSDCMESAFGGELLSCGCWVLQALRTIPELKKVIMVGPADEDGTEEALAAWPQIVRVTEETPEALRRLSEELDEYPVYISLDKDVLDRAEARTAWTQGSMKLPQVLAVIDRIPSRRILGMDVCGELGPNAQDTAGQGINNQTNRVLADHMKTFFRQPQQ